MSTPLQKIPRLVLTGAPASGKTVFFERLRARTDMAEFVFFDELARHLLTEDPTFRLRWGEFHREIYRRQVTRENEITGRPFITDRGTVDAFAFHPESVAAVGTTLETEYRRYTAVVQLGSAASLGKQAYTVDDIRTESIEEALDLENRIRNVWSPHPGYHFLLARSSFEDKYRDLLALILPLAGKIAGTI